MVQSKEHRRRAVEFARALLARSALVSRVRRIVECVGAPAMDLRAGVASGEVVIGPLGNLVMMEFAAIGFVTNLAARLRSVAEPGEVVCSIETVEGLDIAGSRELVEGLKGIDRPVAILRVVV